MVMHLHSYISFHGVPSYNFLLYLSKQRDKMMVQKPAYGEAFSFFGSGSNNDVVKYIIREVDM
jgi:hypothetical protein